MKFTLQFLQCKKVLLVFIYVSPMCLSVCLFVFVCVFVCLQLSSFSLLKVLPLSETPIQKTFASLRPFERACEGGGGGRGRKTGGRYGEEREGGRQMITCAA